MRLRTILRIFHVVPLEHKILAACIAVVVCGGGFALAKYRASQPASPAVLSFDADIARQDESSAAKAADSSGQDEPLAFARSVLTDQLIAGLSIQGTQAGASRSTPWKNAAEFRSRLEFTQVSESLLLVRYPLADPKASAEATNAVANALASWTPPAPPLPQPAPAVSPAPQPAHPRANRHRRKVAAQSDSLSRLETLLEATDRQLALANMQAQQAAALRQAAAGAPPADAEDGTRRQLQAQLDAEQRKLTELRVRYTDLFPDVENTKDNIAEIQQKLAALPPPVRNVRSSGATAPPSPEAHSPEVNRLLQERTRLREEIAVEEQMQTLLQEKTSDTAPASGSATQAAPLPSPPASLPAPPTATPAQPAQSPFRLVKPANPPSGDPMWPMTLTGALGALLYLGSAMWHFRSYAMTPAAVEEAATPREAPFEREAPVIAEVLRQDSEPEEAAASTQGSPQPETPLAIHEAPVLSARDAAAQRSAVDTSWREEVRRSLASTTYGGSHEKPFARRDAATPGALARVDLGASRLKESFPHDPGSPWEAAQKDVHANANHSAAAAEDDGMAMAIAALDQSFEEMELGVAGAREHLGSQLHEIVVKLLSPQRMSPGA
jgi:hypothetical protein